ncbi:MAG: hypothetical protein DHS20C13_22280 [Thermodesulfobacteriota bacterium]|nr:MAG: hypothetical protein DHS20C13_22280 [Thermodesulfobacteriota bacterium]
MMRNPDCLIEFFASKQIVVKIEEKFNNLAEQSRFRFSVAGRFIQESGYEFERFAFAQWAGLEFAFMLLNFQIRQAEKVKIEKFERIKRPKR